MSPEEQTNGVTVREVQTHCCWCVSANVPSCYKVREEAEEAPEAPTGQQAVVI